MTNIQKYLASIDNPNTEKVARHVLGEINSDIDAYKRKDLEQLILNLRPSSKKAVTTICYVLGSYAKWLQTQGQSSDTFLFELRSIDKDRLWNEAKPNAMKKYISFPDFERTLHDIEVYEEFNSLYYATLFRCLYEGIYNDDLSVIKNLRARDIQGSILTLREDDGHEYKFKITPELADNLRELSAINIWERRNRYGICQVDMKGQFGDSVFKVEYRKTNKLNDDSSFKFSYYAKLRKISTEYVEHKLLPLQLYVSGLMYRIGNELNAHGITLQEAFSENCRNKMAHEIISKELIRSNYTAEISNFREMVKSHLEVFL